jgi:hypothetical protein
MWSKPRAASAQRHSMSIHCDWLARLDQQKPVGSNHIQNRSFIGYHVTACGMKDR